jgi:hypothetical protein
VKAFFLPQNVAADTAALLEVSAVFDIVRHADDPQKIQACPESCRQVAASFIIFLC